MGLLRSPAIVGGKGYISTFALLVIAAVFVIAILQAPAIFVGGSLTGAVWKACKTILKRGAS